MRRFKGLLAMCAVEMGMRVRGELLELVKILDLGLQRGQDDFVVLSFSFLRLK